MPPLEGKIALVAGATRGAGRGIACMLGAAGATVYCAGRSIDGQLATAGRPETIDQTAQLVTEQGGVGIAVQTDHTSESQVKTLITRISSDQGRLDILVNDIWGGDALTEWGKPFWKLTPGSLVALHEQAIMTHVITARQAVPLMLDSGPGLIVEITDGANLRYRGNFYYDLIKTQVIRMAHNMALELKATQLAALALTPGFLRSEAVLDHLGVTEDNWRDGITKDPHFGESETPSYVGRAVAALAADSNVKIKAGGVYSSWGLAREYGFNDIDGRQPNFAAYISRLVMGALTRIVEQSPMIKDLKQAVGEAFKEVHLEFMLEQVTEAFYIELSKVGPAKAQLAELEYKWFGME